jgi:anti-sigma28 factor (negative regulator of flagellin synthesis)
MNIPVTIEKTYALLACTECGAEAYASCNCHKPYKPVELAAKAIAANPTKSNRAIAEEIGVSEPTVRRARTASPDAVGSNQPRTGLDGKVRKQPARKTAKQEETPPAPAEAAPAEAAEPTVEEAEAEVSRLKALRAKIANCGDNKVDPEASAKALAEFKFACEAWLPKMNADDLQYATDHFAEVVEVPANELMPDLRSAQFDVKIAKAEVTALKRKLAGKLPPNESRAAAWSRLASEAASNIEELISYQGEFEEARDAQPDSLQDGPFAQKCEAVCKIDLATALEYLQETENADLPLGFGRD